MDRLDMNVADVIRKLVERIERLERGAPVGYTAVSSGALRITSEEGLIVEGSARISGVMNGDGTLNWSGPITFTGPFEINGTTVQNGEYTVTGPFHVNGTTDINGDTTVNGVFDVVGPSTFTGEVTIDGGWHLNGDGDITGQVQVTGDLKVTGDIEILSGGRIKVGDMIFAPTSESGAVGSITSPVALNLKSALTSMSGSAIVDDRLTVVGEIRLPFVGSGTGTPLVIDAFGRIVKQA